MKRIGDIAARLVANPIELVAAANQKRSTEFADGSPNEGVTSEPSRRSVEVSTTRATQSPERVDAPGVAAAKGGQPRGELKLVSINCEPARFAAANVSARTRRVGSHLVLVSGGHARTVPW